MVASDVLNVARCIQIFLVVFLCFISVNIGDTLSSTFVLNDINNFSTVIFKNVSISNNPIQDKPFDINVAIEVPGMESRHVLVYLSVPSAINFVSPAIIDLGNFSEKDGQKVAKWRLVALKPGSFSLNITAYSIGNDILHTENSSGFTSFPLDVSVGFHYEGVPYFQIKNINMFPMLAYPGTFGNKLNINILNVGSVVAYNISAEVKLPEALSLTGGSPSSFYIGRMLPNENFTVSYFINIGNDLTSNVFPLSLMLKHYNGSAILNASIPVAPKAKFVLMDVLSSDQLYPGATNVPLRVVLRNTGNAVAETLTTTLLGGNIIPGVKSSLQTSIGNVENIGNIIPGETFTTTFIVNVDPSTAVAGRQLVNIELAWTQDPTSNTDQANPFVQTVPLTYYIESGPNYLLYYNGIPWMYIIVPTIIGLSIIIFLIIRRQRIRFINNLQSKKSSNKPENISNRSPVRER